MPNLVYKVKIDMKGMKLNYSNQWYGSKPDKLNGTGLTIKTADTHNSINNK
ncbi:hypothetical protein [Spiroplasma sp. AdecLV25b]|uniref:hypothetical protein n=1 Tax=Spiroplasma sp. AdecLV25b TaxID=3027162 RepID=UPI0027E1F449|nr:hypothetical protein [Spiroplasma sp. AdecLV25b]